jgi:hypothetical protein
MTDQGFSARSADRRLDRVMEPEQFNQVIEAILAGKYSLACVLILQFGGYNPLHYIPYRTYNRIVKDQCQTNRRNKGSANHFNADSQKHIEQDLNRHPLRQTTSEISDLNYLEAVSKPHPAIKGGTLTTLDQWLNKTLQDTYCLKTSSTDYKKQAFCSPIF